MINVIKKSSQLKHMLKWSHLYPLLQLTHSLNNQPIMHYSNQNTPITSAPRYEALQHNDWQVQLDLSPAHFNYTYLKNVI